MLLQQIIETSSFSSEMGSSTESMTVANGINIPNSSVTVTILPQILSPPANNYEKVNSIESNDIYSSKAANHDVLSDKSPDLGLNFMATISQTKNILKISEFT